MADEGAAQPPKSRRCLAGPWLSSDVLALCKAIDVTSERDVGFMLQ